MTQENEMYPATHIENASISSSDKNLLYIVYGLYIGAFVLGITAIVGLIIAYLKRNECDSASKSHLDFCIGTFWKSLIFWVITLLLAVTIILSPIAWILGLATVVWYLVRCIKGILLVSKGDSVEKPGTWLW